MDWQFEGTITYGTRCASCNHSSERRSTFLELELNLTVRFPFTSFRFHELD